MRRFGAAAAIGVVLVVAAVNDAVAAPDAPAGVDFPASFPMEIRVGGVSVYDPATTLPPATVPLTTVPLTTVPLTTVPLTTVPLTTVPVILNSGIAMPLVAPANFPKTVLREDFNTPAAEGQFLAVYQPRGISAYPNTYHDTRSKSVGTTDPLNFGTYDPNIISVPVGASYMQLALRTVNGSIRVAAPVPYLNPANTTKKWRDAKNVRVSIAWRSDLLPTRKVAWLLWPSFGTNTSGATSGVGGNGEIDFPEGDLDGVDKINAFLHWQNGTTGNSQTTMPTAVKVTGGWHVTTYEWMSGVSFRAWLDGNLIGTVLGVKVPAEAMHLVLQTETILDPTKPLRSVSGDVLVDWITVETV